jgi:hypothetical protein
MKSEQEWIGLAIGAYRCVNSGDMVWVHDSNENKEYSAAFNLPYRVLCKLYDEPLTPSKLRELKEKAYKFLEETYE